MDYEKKYKDALERAKIELNADTTQGTKNVLMTVFPELKESEDEQIRKGIIDFLWKEKIFLQEAHSSVENNPKYRFVMDAIAWLEKQKAIDKEIIFRPLAGTDIMAAAKQALEKIEIGKEVILDFNGVYIPVNGKTVAEICNEYFAWLEKQGEQKATDKVESKFHEGDWVLYSGDHYEGVRHITKIDENGYYIERNGLPHGIIPFNHEICMRLWTIQDAKDGDVLVDVYGNIGIFQKNDDFDWSSYCSLGSNGGFRCFAIEHELDGSHPATKEQRDTLFKAMTEAGYEWDDDKKESKLLISNGGDFESDDSEQKPTWSDEDERLIYSCIKHIEEELQEISKDKFGHSEIISDLKEDCRERINWLKSLKERLL